MQESRSLTYCVVSPSRYYNTAHRDGYLPVFKSLSRHDVSLRLSLAELRNSEQPQQVGMMPCMQNDVDILPDFLSLARTIFLSSPLCISTHPGLLRSRAFADAAEDSRGCPAHAR